MAEKLGKPPAAVGMKPVPMRLFATLDVDRTPSNCISRNGAHEPVNVTSTTPSNASTSENYHPAQPNPQGISETSLEDTFQLCSLTLSRLVVMKPLGSDLASILIAVKMQGSKRTLRSNEIALPPNGLLDTELELNFCLQYPHFLKRDGNKLHVMLQRRKRYKNRTILGYKTLAEGIVNMSQVLQRQMDLELDLFTDSKEKGLSLISNMVARVTVVALNSQPVDHGDVSKHLALNRVADFTDEEEEFSSNDEGEVEGSDSEPIMGEDPLSRRDRKPPRAKRPVNARQRNLKQKFIALLKRFRVSEDLQGLDNDQEEIGQKLTVAAVPARKARRCSKVFQVKPLPMERSRSVDAVLCPLSFEKEKMLLPAFQKRTHGGDMDPTEIEDLFEELEDLSDSGQEMDTMSISSTPKPSLRPFFSSSRSLLQESLNVPGGPQGYARACPEARHQQPEKNQDRLSDESSKKADSDSHPENWTDHEHSDPQPTSSPPKSSEEKGKDGGERERKSRLFARDRTASGLKLKKQAEKTLSLDTKPVSGQPSPVQSDASLAEPRKVVVEQLARVLAPDDSMPEHLTLVNCGDPQGSLLATRLQDKQHKVIATLGPADVRAVFTCLVAKIHKFCNSNAKPPPAVKVLLAGSDGFVNCVLRQYVEQLSFRPPDWQNYLKFLIVPLGSSNSLARYLASVDGMYGAAFSIDSWKELLERAETQKTDCQEMLNRVHRYLHGAATTLQLPIAEAMITYREKSSDDESSQVFIPFICEVRLGSPETPASVSVDMDEAKEGTMPLLSGSPPSLGGGSITEKKERITPPSSPNVNSAYTSSVVKEQSLSEPLELQLDYWQGPGRPPLDKASKLDSSKSSVKNSFRSLQVQRLALPGELPSQHFVISYSTKEKKQKIMRLGKKKEKEKESEPKSLMVDAVSRLICSAKTHNIPLKVCIDGTEWSGVKFFQLSAQWQTQIKHFPVSLFSFPEMGL